MTRPADGVARGGRAGPGGGRRRRADASAGPARSSTRRRHSSAGGGAPSGAIRLGEIVEVSLTCAVLERDDVRAVPDQSRLTVAAIQMAPFEIVGGSDPPDLRSGDRRFFERRYQIRIIDPDVIGRDVKLPPLAIPYRVESRVGAGSTLTGRDLVHLMPQLVFRVVSQVPADATDIRDASDAGLGRIDALSFRASAFRVAALILAGLAVIVALSALPGLLGRLRGDRRRAVAPVSDHAVLQAVAKRLGALDRRPSYRRPRSGRAGRGPSTRARRRRDGVRGGGASGAAGPREARCPRAGSRWTAGSAGRGRR